jgi:hypothetical protein
VDASRDAVAEVEFLEDAGDVGLCGRFSDDELLADFAVARKRCGPAARGRGDGGLMIMLLAISAAAIAGGACRSAGLRSRSGSCS